MSTNLDSASKVQRDISTLKEKNSENVFASISEREECPGVSENVVQTTALDGIASNVILDDFKIVKDSEKLFTEEEESLIEYGEAEDIEELDQVLGSTQDKGVILVASERSLYLNNNENITEEEDAGDLDLILSESLNLLSDLKLEPEFIDEKKINLESQLKICNSQRVAQQTVINHLNDEKKIFLENAHNKCSIGLRQSKDCLSNLTLLTSRFRSVTRNLAHLSDCQTQLMRLLGALQRLSAFFKSVELLEKLIVDRNFHKIPDVLLASRQLSHHFSSVTGLLKRKKINSIKGGNVSPNLNPFEANVNPFLSADIGDHSADKMKETILVQLCERLEIAQKTLITLSIEVFNEAFGSSGSISFDRKNLLEKVSMCLDAVEGYEGKRAFTTWYSERQLRDYKQVFSTRELSGIDGVSKRYAWLQRLILQYEVEHASILPKDWYTDEHLCVQFCLITRKDLQRCLGEECDTSKVHAAVRQTAALDAFLSRRFYADETVRKNMELDTKSDDRLRLMGVFEASAALFQFVDAHDIRISSEIQRLSVVDISNLDGLISAGATELFLLYRQVLADVVQLSRRRPILDVAAIFVKHLTAFRVLLQCQMCGEKPQLALEEPDTSRMCVLINTSHWCQITTHQMAMSIRDIAHPAYKEAISFESVEREFFHLSAVLVSRLVSSIIAHVAPVWKVMASGTNWSTLEAVGDESEFVKILKTRLNSAMSPVRKFLVLGEQYAQSLADRIVVSVARSFHAVAACKIRPLTETAAQQLLLDVEAMRNLLLDSCASIVVANAHGMNNESVNSTVGFEVTVTQAMSETTTLVRERRRSIEVSSISRLINRETRNTEAMLKTMLVSIVDPGNFVQNFILVNRRPSRLRGGGPWRYPAPALLENALDIKGVSDRKLRTIFLDGLADQSKTSMTEGPSSVTPPVLTTFKLDSLRTVNAAQDLDNDESIL